MYICIYICIYIYVYMYIYIYRERERVDTRLRGRDARESRPPVVEERVGLHFSGGGEPG